jgi:hypothetical protein
MKYFVCLVVFMASCFPDLEYLKVIPGISLDDSAETWIYETLNAKGSFAQEEFLFHRSEPAFVLLYPKGYEDSGPWLGFSPDPARDPELLGFLLYLSRGSWNQLQRLNLKRALELLEKLPEEELLRFDRVGFQEGLAREKITLYDFRPVDGYLCEDLEGVRRVYTPGGEIEYREGSTAFYPGVYRIELEDRKHALLYIDPEFWHKKSPEDRAMGRVILRQY